MQRDHHLRMDTACQVLYESSVSFVYITEDVIDIAVSNQVHPEGFQADGVILIANINSWIKKTNTETFEHSLIDI